jgi:transposase
MKDRSDRAARLQLIGGMFAGQSWPTAVAESHLHLSRATPSRLVQQARNEDHAIMAFLDDRHAHPYKVTEPVQVWINQLCSENRQLPSSLVQRELKSRFGVAVSVRQLNRVRATLGVSNQWRGRTQGTDKKHGMKSHLPGKKASAAGGCWLSMRR